jgi:hypothetical protein
MHINTHTYLYIHVHTHTYTHVCMLDIIYHDIFDALLVNVLVHFHKTKRASIAAQYIATYRVSSIMMANTGTNSFSKVAKYQLKPNLRGMVTGVS